MGFSVLGEGFCGDCGGEVSVGRWDRGYLLW